ncbi:hypothetical protein [Niveispirillum sp. KHB5.9]|uniref:hypothetical protein n=1 Tax=Niveispirillum sp. KHB5.9 TaxID=3400269 RepID=UPI003A884F0A
MWGFIRSPFLAIILLSIALVATCTAIVWNGQSIYDLSIANSLSRHQSLIAGTFSIVAALIGFAAVIWSNQQIALRAKEERDAKAHREDELARAEHARAIRKQQYDVASRYTYRMQLLLTACAHRKASLRLTESTLLSIGQLNIGYFGERFAGSEVRTEVDDADVPILNSFGPNLMNTLSQLDMFEVRYRNELLLVREDLQDDSPTPPLPTGAVNNLMKSIADLCNRLEQIEAQAATIAKHLRSICVERADVTMPNVTQPVP